MPACRTHLVLDETETDDPALIGEMCHMVGESEDGPRGSSTLSREQRDLYGNLLLLCRNHHGEIDRQPETWPVERLQQVKNDHEAWVREALPGYDSQKQRDDETYAGYIDQWARRCHLDTWTEWTSWPLSGGQPSLPVTVDKDLAELRRWLLKRIWPGRYQKLEQAFGNFSRVLQDFHNVFHEHAERPRHNPDTLYTKKFYKIEHWDDDLYHRLHAQYEHHVDLVQDLILELARAANLICDEIRTNLLASFRMNEGRLSIQTGPHEDLSWRETVVQYDAAERAAGSPYPGLSAFLTARAERDMFFGSTPAPAQAKAAPKGGPGA